MSWMSIMYNNIWDKTDLNWLGMSVWLAKLYGLVLGLSNGEVPSSSSVFWYTILNEFSTILLVPPGKSRNGTTKYSISSPFHYPLIILLCQATEFANEGKPKQRTDYNNCLLRCDSADHKVLPRLHDITKPRDSNINNFTNTHFPLPVIKQEVSNR